MIVESSCVSDVLIVRVVDKTLDADNVGEFLEHVLPMIESRRHVVFDMTHVCSVDSSGIGALVTVWREAGGTVTLSGMRPQLSSIFELVRMSETFLLESVVKAAVASAKRDCGQVTRNR